MTDETIDEIVTNARQHKLVLNENGEPDLSHSAVVGGVVFARCSVGCNVSVGTLVVDTNRVHGDVIEAEARHQLYVAVTDAVTRKQPAQAIKAIPEPRPQPGDPCKICGTPMRRMADGSGECLSDHK